MFSISSYTVLFCASKWEVCLNACCRRHYFVKINLGLSYEILLLLWWQMSSSSAAQSFVPQLLWKIVLTWEKAFLFVLEKNLPQLYSISCSFSLCHAAETLQRDVFFNSIKDFWKIITVKRKWFRIISSGIEVGF